MENEFEDQELQEIRKEFEIQNPEKENFEIRNDMTAEWALSKIRKNNSLADRILKSINVMTRFLEYRRDQVTKSKEMANERYIQYLNGYFQKVEYRETKTMKVYDLPTGKLMIKSPKQKFIRNDAELLEWLKTNKQEAYIAVKETPKWDELKKTVTVNGQNVIDENGEIVAGVVVEISPPEFAVELREI
jgi:hypothetical protein